MRKGGIGIPAADPEIFKKEGALCRSPWLVDEENSRFQMVFKGQINVRNYFLTNYFLVHWRIFKLCPFLHIIKAWWWNIIKFLNFTNAFRGDTQDFEDARLILTSPACKWLEKSRWLQKIGRAPKSASDFTLGKYCKLVLCQ